MQLQLQWLQFAIYVENGGSFTDAQVIGDSNPQRTGVIWTMSRRRVATAAAAAAVRPVTRVVDLNIIIIFIIMMMIIIIIISSSSSSIPERPGRSPGPASASATSSGRWTAGPCQAVRNAAVCLECKCYVHGDRNGFSRTYPLALVFFEVCLAPARTYKTQAEPTQGALWASWGPSAPGRARS